MRHRRQQGATCARKGRSCVKRHSGAAVRQVLLSRPSLQTLGEVGDQRAGAWELACPSAAVVREKQRHQSHSSRTCRREGALREPPAGPSPQLDDGWWPTLPSLSGQEAQAGGAPTELSSSGGKAGHAALGTPPDRDSKAVECTLTGHSLVPTLPWHMPPRQDEVPGDMPVVQYSHLARK